MNRVMRKRNSIRTAKSLHTRFTGHKGEVVGVLDIDDLDGQAAVIVGSLDGVLYTTVRDGRTEHYVHEFKPNARPTLCVTADGERIIVIGGNFRFTDAGFEDFKNRKKR